MTGHAINDTVLCLLIVAVHAANTLLATKDPKLATVLSYSDFLSQVRHFKADLFTKTGERIISWFHLTEDRRKLRFARRRHSPNYKISRTEITHGTVSSFEDKLNFIETGMYYNPVGFPFEYAQIDAQN